MDKPKALVIGGKPFNLPAELKRLVEIERHIVQEDLKHWRPVTFSDRYDVVLVIKEFASPKAVKMAEKAFGCPVVLLQRGWARMREELIRYGFLLNDIDPSTPKPKNHAPPIPESPPKEAPPPPVPTESGLPPEELWRVYGAKIIETIRQTVKPAEKVPMGELVDTLAVLVGISCKEVEALFPQLQLRGIIMACLPGDRWMRTPDLNDEVEVAQAERREYQRGERTVENSALMASAKLIAGLPMGPYMVKAALVFAMSDHTEWAHLKPGALLRRINMAIKLGIVEENHGRFYVDHSAAITLTLRTVTA